MNKILFGLIVVGCFLIPYSGDCQSISQHLQQSDYLKRTGHKAAALESLEQIEQQAANQKVEVLVATAATHLYFMDYDSAIVHATNAIALAEVYRLLPAKIEALRILGETQILQFNYEAALDACEQARTLAEKLRDNLALAYCQVCVTRTINNYVYGIGENKEQQMLVALERAMNIAEAKQDTSNYQKYLSMLADYRVNSPDTAQLLFEQLSNSLAIHPNIRVAFRNFIHKANYFDLLGQADSTLSYLQRALALSKTMQSRILEEHSYFQLAYFYLERAEYAQSLVMTDNIRALKPQEEARSLYDLYYQNYKGLNQLDSALIYLEKNRAELMHSFTTDRTAEITKWEKAYETKEKEQLLQAQQFRLRILLLSLGFVLLMGGVLIWRFREKQKANRQLQQQNAIIQEQAKDLQSLDQMKSNFFANISHELRTPLTMIQGPIEELLSKKVRSQKEHSLLLLIKNNSKKLLQLVNQILTLTKLEQSTLELEEDVVNFYALNQRILSTFQSYAAVEAWQFSLNMEISTDLALLLDTYKYETILTNLLSNAFKFTPKGGDIQVQIQEEKKQILIKVQDSGRGIRTVDLPHIFDRFYQGNQDRTMAEGGTGIGLALSQELAKAMNGKLWAASEWGKGSQFFFSFPKKVAVEGIVTKPNEDSIAPISTVVATPNSAKARLLLVEDNPDLRTYVQLLLQDQYQLQTVSNGIAALNSLEQHLPDLIISDLMMPQMDGYELLKILKSKTAYQRIPVIMLTARAEKSDRLQALRIGVDDYMTKPFDKEELQVRIHNLLQHAQARKEWMAAVEAVAEDTPAGNVETAPIAEDWLHILEVTVQQHLSDAEFSIQQLADLLQISRTQLFRRLKKATGLSPSQYLKEARLQQARLLLEEKNFTSVKVVMYQVGIKHQSNFSKDFKKRFGKLPSEYL